MEIPKEKIEEFRAAYREATGEEMSFEEAEAEFRNLVELVWLVIKR